MKLKNIKVGDTIEAKKDMWGDNFSQGGKYLVTVVDNRPISSLLRIRVIDDNGCELWVDPADFRKPRTKLKQLDQSVFDGLDEKWRFAAVDEDGMAFIYQSKPRLGSTYFIGGNGCDYVEFGTGYDASNWQSSLIERDIAKELLEVDLSSELTGDDLCRAMLARGDTRIMCEVYDDGNRNNLTHVIREYRDDKFHTKANRWSHAIPINNQGKRLTAREAGL